MQEVLVCTEPEVEPHYHDESCYTKEVVCGLEECQPHQHTDACWKVEQKLVCELPIHEHTLQCFSNPEADVETSAVWERALARVELTGNWNEDVLAIAQTQLGYSESTANYKVQEDGTTIKGYTRYGAWYGDPYGDWCAMFCSFCMNYAEVDNDLIPFEDSCPHWVEKLSSKEYDLYHSAGTYSPVPGDLIFFDWDRDGSADHVGFVYEVAEATENETAKVRTIEGNKSDCVKYDSYDADDSSILGYGEMQSKPQKKAMPKVSLGAGKPSEYVVVAKGNNSKYYAMSDTGAAVEVDYDESVNTVSSASDDLIWQKNGSKLNGKADPNKHIAAGVDHVPVKNTEANVIVSTEHGKSSIYTSSRKGNKTTYYSLELNDTNTAFEVNTLMTAAPTPMLMLARLAAAPAPDQGSDDFQIPEEITTEIKANDWQVVSGRYTGDPEIDGNVIYTTVDGNVFRLKKNVVPTGTENEFYVYLSIEPVFYHDWITLFKASGMLVCSNNSQPSFPNAQPFSTEDGVEGALLALAGGPGHESNVQGGQYSLLLDDSTTFTTYETRQTKKEVYINRIVFQRYANDPNPMVLEDAHLAFSLSQNSGSSFTIVYSPAGSQIPMQLSNVTREQSGKNSKENPGSLILPPAAFEMLINSYREDFEYMKQRTFPEIVTDPMGDNITYLGIETCTAGSASYNTTDKTITWDLSEYEYLDPPQEAESYELIETEGIVDDSFCRECCYQLTYKIRLNVESSGFTSCANAMEATSGATVNPTNNTTPITYITETDNTTKTTYFDIPKVRGLLYDVVFKKVDESGNTLPGAKFELKNSAGVTVKTLGPGDITNFRFDDLAFGDYTLCETPPEGYIAHTTEIPITLCYSTNADDLSPDSEKQGNMRYSALDKYSTVDDATMWRIVNSANAQYLVLKKVDDSGNPLSGAEFILYKSDGESEWDTKLIPSKEDGIFTPKDFCLDYGTYYLVEMKAPVGYTKPDAAIVLTVNENGVSVSRDGSIPTSVPYRVENNTNIYELNVENSQAYGPPLPETGGIGIPLFTLGGLVLP